MSSHPLSFTTADFITGWSSRLAACRLEENAVRGIKVWVKAPGATSSLAQPNHHQANSKGIFSKRQRDFFLHLNRATGRSYLFSANFRPILMVFNKLQSIIYDLCIIRFLKMHGMSRKEISHILGRCRSECMYNLFDALFISQVITKGPDSMRCTSSKPRVTWIRIGALQWDIVEMLDNV